MGKQLISKGNKENYVPSLYVSFPSIYLYRPVSLFPQKLDKEENELEKKDSHYQ